MTEARDVLDELRSQLDRYDPERFPVQHATASFHLGTVLLQRGEVDGAVHALERARDLFPPDGLPVEHAKSANMLGVALREAGRAAEAEVAFARAADLLDDRPANRLEAAASRFNRGLVLRDLGRDHDAREAFRAALEVFREGDAREQAAAAARELGTTLLGLGELDAAVDVLEQAVELARRGGDRVGIGAAANVLGIVHLQAGRSAQARAAFEDATGAHPRSVRPEAYAMARANAALAAWRDGDPHHAALAARQALAIEAAAPEVQAQAQQVLDGYDSSDDPLFEVLCEVLRDRAPEAGRGTLRAEQARLADAPDTDVDEHVRAVVELISHDPRNGLDLAEVWLDVLLEQPPTSFRRLVVAAERHVAGHADGDTVRHVLARAMARFHVPQWTRLRDTFNAAAQEHGRDPAWR